MKTQQARPRTGIIRKLDRIGLWTFLVGSVVVLALGAWALIVTIAALIGGVTPREEPLAVEVLKSGAPPIFDQAHGAVMILGKFQWFGSEDPGSAGAQLYLWSTLVSALTVIAVTGMVALLSTTLLRGRPFTRTATWFIGITGIILMVGGIVSQLLSALSRWVLVDGLKYLGAPNGVTVPVPSWTIDFTPIAAGAVLAVIASAFEIGQRMQRDTEGLV